MKKYIYILSFAALGLMACSLDREPLSDQSELNLSTGDGDTSRIKFKDRAAIYAVYNDLYTPITLTQVLPVPRSCLSKRTLWMRLTRILPVTGIAILRI